MIERSQIRSLDVAGKFSRVIDSGPDETGKIRFTDGSEAYLHCPHFEGQGYPEGNKAVIMADRAAREAAGLILPILR